jgi:putative glycosyltransferase
MKLSVVSTLFKSELHLAEFSSRALNAATKIYGNQVELILVNDGSPDKSLDIAIQISKNYSNVTVVDLSKNFGHHNAMLMGLLYAKGEKVFLIDCDLEEQPEWIDLFDRLLIEKKVDVVFGTQKRRRGGLFEQWSGKFFYGLFRWLSGIEQPNDVLTVRLMSRRYVRALLMHNEKAINIGGLFLLTGFTQFAQPVEKLATSPTSYSFRKKISHFVNGITSFSSTPLVFIFFAGLVIAGISGIFIIGLLFQHLVLSSPPPGYSSIIASIWLSTGIMVTFIGIIGIYLSKIFLEVKQRPVAIVRAIFKSAESQNTTLDA